MALPRNCALCGETADHLSVVTAHVYGSSNGHAIFQCTSCGVRFLYPGLDKEQEARLYAAEFEKFMADRSAVGAGWEKPEAHIAANERERIRRLEHLAPLMSGRRTALEVGCSSGFMLYPLRDAGLACTGIEPSGVFADYVRHRGIACHTGLDDLPAEARFDLILHYYVMEHVADPLAFLQRQVAALAPGGSLVFEVPCADDALATLYDVPAYERFIWVVSHRWYFSQESLAYLLGKLGLPFEVRLDQRYDLSNHLVWARDGRPGGLGRFTETLGAELEEHYRQALIKAGRADTLIGVITKTE